MVGNFGVDRLLFRQIFVLLLKICPMKRILLWAVVLLGLPTVSRSLAQSNFREQIEARNREIIAEGDLLYRCERAAWLATDIALAHEELKNNFWGYIVSPEEDTVRVVILDDSLRCISSLSFSGFPEGACILYPEVRALSPRERTLYDVRMKILDEIVRPKYGLTAVPEGFSLNFSLVPCERGYKMYVLTGATVNGVIPFGNDYLFETDLEGQIKSWRKYHSGLLPVYCEAREVIQVIHSHLASEPLITPTDICTLRLYGDLCGVRRLVVFSTALDAWFEYDAQTNAITQRDKSEIFETEKNE